MAIICTMFGWWTMLWIRTSVSMTVWRHLAFRILTCFTATSVPAHTPVNTTPKEHLSLKVNFFLLHNRQWGDVRLGTCVGSRGPLGGPKSLKLRTKTGSDVVFFSPAVHLDMVIYLHHPCWYTTTKNEKLEDWYPGSEVRSLKSKEVLSLKSEVSILKKSEVWSLKSEAWILNSEFWIPKSESLRSEIPFRLSYIYHWTFYQKKTFITL